MAHGLLFLAYLFSAYNMASKFDWSFRKQAKAYIAAFLPFGTFVFNAKYLKQN